MSLGQLRIDLTLDDSGFVKKISSAGRVVKSVGKDFDSTARSVKNIEKGVTGLLPRLRDLSITASILKGGLHNLYNVTLGWQKTIIDTNANIERMTFLLKGMSNAASESERIKDAADDVKFLFDQAERAPFAMNEMTNTLVKMRSVGLEGAREGMIALTDSVAQFGGTDETLHRATIAIQQMAGKGVISMEELRQQLGEAVPTAIKLMARSMNLTYQELVDAISTGRVEANDALQRMFREMERTMGGAGQRMMETWSGMIAQMHTRWTRLQIAIGDQGMFQEAKNGLQLVIDQMDAGKIAGYAETWGRLLSNIISGVTKAAQFMLDWGGVIYDVAKAALYMFGIWKGLSLVNSLVTKSIGAMVAFKTSIATTAVAFSKVNGASGLFAAATGRNTEAIKRLIRMNGLLKFSFKAMWSAALGPIGLVIAGVVALNDAFGWTSDAVDKATKLMEQNTSAISKNSQEVLRAGIAQRRESVRTLEALVRDGEAKVAKYKEQSERGVAWATRLYNDEVALLEKNKAKRGEYNRDLLAMERRLSDGLAEAKEHAYNRIVQISERGTAKELATVNAQYSKAMDDLEKRVEANAITRADAIVEKTAIIKESYDQQMLIERRALDELVQREAEAGDEIEKNGIAAAIASQIEKIKGLNDKRAEEIANAGKSANLLVKPGGANSRLENIFANATADIKRFNAELESGAGAAERFKSQLLNGVYGDAGRELLKNEEALKRYTDALTEREKVEERLKQHKKEEATILRANEKLLEDNTEAQSEYVATLAEARGQGEQTVIAKINLELEKLKRDLGVATPEATAQLNAMRDALYNTKGLEAGMDLREETAQIRNSLMRDEDRYLAERDQKLAKLKEKEVLLENMKGEAKLIAEKDFQENKQAIMDEYARNTESSTDKLLREWSDVSGRMKDATADWINDASDKLTDFVMTGKADFGDLAESILKDIIRIQIQGSISQALGGGGGGFGGGGGDLLGSIGSMVANNTGSNFAGSSLEYALFDFLPFANGGIMTDQGSVPLNMYANGGIANSPQMAMFGEGRQPEAYVPLPDGRTIPVTMSGGGNGGGNAPEVHVNVINQTSQEVDANQGNVKFDGKKFVLDVVLQAAGSPGPFRDSMRGSLK